MTKTPLELAEEIILENETFGAAYPNNRLPLLAQEVKRLSEENVNLKVSGGEIVSRSQMRRLAVQDPDALIKEIEKLKEEHAKWARSVGVACLKDHDLVGGYGCPRCLEEQSTALKEAEEIMITWQHSCDVRTGSGLGYPMKEWLAKWRTEK